MLKWNKAGLLISADQMMTKHGQIIMEMADEIRDLNQQIERLRWPIMKIEKAITNEGKMPLHHREVMKRHRQEWKTLHNAIDEAIKAVHHG